MHSGESIYLCSMSPGLAPALGSRSSSVVLEKIRVIRVVLFWFLQADNSKTQRRSSMGPKSNPASPLTLVQGTHRGRRRHNEFPSLKRPFPKKNRPPDEEEAGSLNQISISFRNGAAHPRPLTAVSDRDFHSY